MQKLTLEENACTSTVQLPQISLCWHRFMYIDALSLTVQIKSLIYIEALLTSLLFSPSLSFFKYMNQVLNQD